MPGFAADTLTQHHGFSRFGELKYGPDFRHFDYVRPDAPKGGTLRLMGYGSFDTLNAYTLKGTSPFNTPGLYLFGVGELNDTLLAGTGELNVAGDEVQSAYGLIAASLSYPPDLAYVDFRLRPEARFHDGHPIRADDVRFSWQTLVKDGHPRFRQDLENIDDVEIIDPLQVRFRFKHAGRRMDVLMAGSMPVLPKHFWQGKAFADTLLTPPLLSGPYRIGKVDPGHRITYERVPDYWAATLPVNIGRHNFDQVEVEFYRDLTVGFEAFKAGHFDIYSEYIAKNWATGYTGPAFDQGKIVRAEIPHSLPPGVQGFFFNTRRAPFNARAVREALGLLFDFDWTNTQLFHGAYRRTTSYFPNTAFAANTAMTPGERGLLQQVAPSLVDAPLPSEKPFALRDRVRSALALLASAGWHVNTDGQLVNVDNKPLTFEVIYLQQGMGRVLEPWLKNLERVGVHGSLRLLDASVFKQRTDTYDYDIITYVLPQARIPGQDLLTMFHSSSASQAGSLNLAGIQRADVDALIQAALQASNETALKDATRALDRVLLSEHFMVPNWYLNYYRLAWWNQFDRPRQAPAYSLGVDTWWSKDKNQNN